MLKGYRLNSRKLLLSQSALFYLPFGEGSIGEENSKYALINRICFTSSLCYVARDSYWEQLVQYPTGNLLEVYKIIKAEVAFIAPVEGRTFYYIVNTSKDNTAVLYCCFSEKVIEKANQLSLWRIQPETLPYYRYLYGRSGVYLTRLPLAFLKNRANEQVETGDQIPDSEVLIKIDGSNCSSLPVNKTKLDDFTAATIDEASIIEQDEVKLLFNKFNLFSLADFLGQVVQFLMNTLNNKGYLVRYLAIVFITFILTFIVGKSATLTWYNNYVNEQIASAKSSAVTSLKLSNELRDIKSDISKVNASLELQVSKKALLNILSSLVTEENELEFTVIDISQNEMQLRGTTKSSVDLLTALSNASGFDEVKFYSPPASLKNGLERFFITLRFDQNITINNDEEPS